jgi:hypothetical protein
LFICFIIIGLAGALYFYHNLKDLNTKLGDTQQKLQESKDSLQESKDSLQLAKNTLTQYKITIDNYVLLSDSINKHTDEKNPGLDSLVKVINHSRDTAREYAHKGYYDLKDYHFDMAMKDFHKSELAYNGYHDSYEVYFLLWQSKQGFDDPVVQKQLMEKILAKYNSFGLLNKKDIR